MSDAKYALLITLYRAFKMIAEGIKAYADAERLRSDQLANARQ